MPKKQSQHFEDEQIPSHQLQQYPQGVPVSYPQGIPVGEISQEMRPEQPMNYYQTQPQHPQQVFNPYILPSHILQQPRMASAHGLLPGSPFAPPMPPPPINPQMVPPPIQNVQSLNHPVIMLCPCCKSTVQTIVNKESGNTTYLWSFAICCFFGPFCCLPFLVDGCLDKNHYCSHCGHNILRKHQRCFEFIGC